MSNRLLSAVSFCPESFKVHGEFTLVPKWVFYPIALLPKHNPCALVTLKCIPDSLNVLSSPHSRAAWLHHPLRPESLLPCPSYHHLPWNPFRAGRKYGYAIMLPLFCPLGLYSAFFPVSQNLTIRRFPDWSSPLSNSRPTISPVSDYQATVLLASTDRSYGLNGVPSTRLCVLMSSLASASQCDHIWR